MARGPTWTIAAISPLLAGTLPGLRTRMSPLSDAAPHSGAFAMRRMDPLTLRRIGIGSSVRARSALSLNSTKRIAADLIPRALAGLQLGLRLAEVVVEAGDRLQVAPDRRAQGLGLGRGLGNAA